MELCKDETLRERLSKCNKDNPREKKTMLTYFEQVTKFSIFCFTVGMKYSYSWSHISSVDILVMNTVFLMKKHPIA